MKSLFTLFLFVFSISNSIAQDSLKGMWKAVGMSTDYFYINNKTDSTNLSANMKMQFPDSISQTKFFKEIDTILSVIHFSLKSDGSYTAQFDEKEKEEGTYEINYKDNNISFTHKIESGNMKTDIMKYQIKNGLLYLSYTAPNGMSSDFIFEKKL